MIETPGQTNESDPATSPAVQSDDTESDSADTAADNPPSVSLQSVADDDSLLDRVISGVRGVAVKLRGPVKVEKLDEITSVDLGVLPPLPDTELQMIETSAETNESDPATSPAVQSDDIESDSADTAADNPPSVSLQSVAEDDSLLERVISGVREVFDPEIPLNIYDLGLIYRIDIDTDNQVAIDMTLTSPMCPVAGSLPGEVENAARGVAGVADVVVELVWDPPWDPEVMSEAARLELGLF